MKDKTRERKQFHRILHTEYYPTNSANVKVKEIGIYSRAGLASIIVLSILALIPISGFLVQPGYAQSDTATAQQSNNSTKSLTDYILEESGAPTSNSLESLLESNTYSEETAYSQKTSADCIAAFVSTSTLPPDFINEVSDLSSYDEIVANEDGSLVGCCASGDASLIFSALKSILEDKGWVYATSGYTTMGSFAKNFGTYRWLYVSCMAIGDKTSIVFQLN